MKSRFTLAAIAVVVLLAACALPAAATILWQEGFETYNTDPGQTWGSLDKNAAGGPNAAPNGSGNPWFGPKPNNGWVTQATTNPVPLEETVTPHSGNYMMRGNRNADGWYYAYDGDIDHVNIAYRFNGGQTFKTDFAIDWWFYDILGNTWPNDYVKGPGCFGDAAGLEYRSNAPTNTDYTNNGELAGPSAQLFLGASDNSGAGYNKHVYQALVLGASGTGFYGGGWYNTTMTRSKGWHHAMISVDANSIASFFIDDQLLLSRASGAPNGFNVFTTKEISATPDQWNQSVYYDDITLRAVPEPCSLIALGAGLVSLLGLKRRRS